MATANSIGNQIGNFDFEEDQTVGAGQDNFVLTYDDGDGLISLEAATGAPDQNIFETVAGDAGTPAVADTTTDTLTIAGGTGITTTGTAASDTITIDVDDDYLLNTGDVGTGVYDFGGATSFELPNGATPTVAADGEIAFDTTVTDFSTGLLRFFGNEEQAIVAMPVAEFTSPTDGHVVKYNATNDEFELVAEAAATPYYTWSEETGTSFTMAVNNAYIINNAALNTATLPTTAAVGDRVIVTGKGAGGWRIAQNASEQIHFGNQSTTVGVGGRLDSTNQRDTVELVCVVADTEWNVISSIGNITIT